MKRSEIKSPFKPLSAVQPRKVDFLFKPIIPYSMITVLEGDPGAGKSYFALWLACAVSTGLKLPNGIVPEKAAALCLCAEDDAEYTLRPRVDKMEGNPSRIFYLANELLLDEVGCKMIEKEVIQRNASLIIVDPLISYMPQYADAHNSTDIRSVLGRLKRLAETTGAAILIVRHLTKTPREKAIYRGVGTVDMIAAARSACLVGLHPDDPDLRVIAHIKHNVSMKGPSYAFELIQGKESEVPQLKWHGEVELAAEQILQLPQQEPRPIEHAIEFLKTELKDGPRSVDELLDKAQTRTISKRTLDRAKQDLKVVSRKNGAGWTWRLLAERHTKDAKL
jgi:hypothetical protein